MTDLTFRRSLEARDRLKSRAISSLEITKAHLEAIERAQGLNAFVAVTADKALRMAEASDARLARKEAGPLEGLPIGVKDLYATKVSTRRRAAISLMASSRHTNQRSPRICGATAR